MVIRERMYEMITLKNVSKFYYNKGIIASGFTKLNLNLSIGEFVAITGESGSGKSTLLNVLSGLDSYEEGEMYINGRETSHYTERDFEEYRRKYISNIFQNFNLINSYTVYQNIELVLLLHGVKKEQVKPKVMSLMKQVGLTKYKHTKAAKLSGGQKQRVAIARALAKETPIIIADEPTGNLDSKTATGIMRLLHDISKEKLVIVVTHNYEQVEPYVTRKITMHDGRILEDKVISKPLKEEYVIPEEGKHLSIWNKTRLGLRNSFNIIPKFLLVLFVYLFVTVAVISEYAFFKQQEYTTGKNGYNNFFTDTSDNRLIIKKQDTSEITEEDYQKISELSGVDYIVKNDLLIDTTVSLRDGNSFYFDATLNDKDTFRGTIGLGKFPEGANEILLVGSPDSYYLGTLGSELIGKEVSLVDMYGNETQSQKVKITGICYDDSYYAYGGGKIYADSSLLEELKFAINREYSSLKVLFMDHYHHSYSYDIHYQVIPNDNVLDGEVYISEDLKYLCKNENCLNQPFKIEVNNLYYQDSLDLKVTKIYNKKNMEQLLGLKDYEDKNGAIFISINQYRQLFNKGNYQSSVFTTDVSVIDKVANTLEQESFSVLKMKYTLVTGGSVEALKIIRTIVTGVLLITLFFIAYFVIRIILKSRNIYFGTIRILGASKKEAKQLLQIELFVVSNLAYFIFLFILYLNYKGLINIGFCHTILKYLERIDYMVLYIVMMIMSYFISIRFARKIFQKSAMYTMREEV